MYRYKAKVTVQQSQRIENETSKLTSKNWSNIQKEIANIIGIDPNSITGTIAKYNPGYIYFATCTNLELLENITAIEEPQSD